MSPSLIPSARVRSVLTPIAVASLILAGASTAHADEVPSAEAAVEAIQEVAPELAEPDAISVTSEGEVEASSDLIDVTIPAEASGVVDLTAGDDTVSFGIPGNGEGEVVAGSVVYEDSMPATDIVVEPVENGARALIKIDGPDAPTRFDFPVDVPEGGALNLTPEGGALALDAEGNPITEVSPPWAKDANGDPVSTHFEVTDDGRHLVQVVDHAAGTAYPVVADPLWLAPVAWWVVRSVVVNIGVKWLYQRWGYQCSPIGPAWLACYKYVR